MKLHFLLAFVLIKGSAAKSFENDDYHSPHYEAKKMMIDSINQLVVFLDKSYMCSEKCYMPLVMNAMEGVHISSNATAVSKVRDEMCGLFDQAETCLKACPDGLTKKLMSTILLSKSSSQICSEKFNAMIQDWPCIYDMLTNVTGTEKYETDANEKMKKLVNALQAAFFEKRDLESFTNVAVAWCELFEWSAKIFSARSTQFGCNKQALQALEYAFLAMWSMPVEYLLEAGVNPNALPNTCKALLP